MLTVMQEQKGTLLVSINEDSQDEKSIKLKNKSELCCKYRHLMETSKLFKLVLLLIIQYFYCNV